jgi:hypothetical protein
VLDVALVPVTVVEPPAVITNFVPTKDEPEGV